MFNVFVWEPLYIFEDINVGNIKVFPCKLANFILMIQYTAVMQTY